MPHASLPDDIDALKQLVIEQRALLAAQEEQLLSRDVLIEKLRIDLLRLKRMRFGRSSEQLDAKIAQLELTLEELEASKTQIAPAVATAVAEEPSERPKPTRKALPPQLPRENVVHTPACSCGNCGGELERLGEDVSEVLEYVPSHFKVIRHVRPKFACTSYRSITQSPAPERPIARGLAGPGLLAHVLVSKYCDHLPLYRQSEIYARSGVELERSTLADWVGQCSALLAPLANSLNRYVLAGSKLHADDTPVPVLQPGRGTTKHGRLWTYVRDDRASASNDPAAVWFAYSPDRKGIHPHTHLQRFRGVLQADGYAGFDRLFNEADAEHPIQEAACWAHARRKFSHDRPSSVGAKHFPGAACMPRLCFSTQRGKSQDAERIATVTDSLIRGLVPHDDAVSEGCLDLRSEIRACRLQKLARGFPQPFSTSWPLPRSMILLDGLPPARQLPIREGAFHYAIRKPTTRISCAIAQMKPRSSRAIAVTAT